MPTPIENRDTTDLLEQLYLYISGTTGQAMHAELTLRVIKENDADDSEQHRGGIRPKRNPIV